MPTTCSPLHHFDQLYPTRLVFAHSDVRAVEGAARNTPPEQQQLAEPSLRNQAIPAADQSGMCLHILCISLKYGCLIPYHSLQGRLLFLKAKPA